MLFQSMSSIIAALVIGFVYSWRLALIILAFAPFMIVSGAIRAKFIYGKKKGAGGNAAFEEGGKVTSLLKMLLRIIIYFRCEFVVHLVLLKNVHCVLCVCITRFFLQILLSITVDWYIFMQCFKFNKICHKKFIFFSSFVLFNAIVCEIFVV